MLIDAPRVDYESKGSGNEKKVEKMKMSPETADEFLNKLKDINL